MKKKIIVINQSANYLVEDIAKALLETGGYDEVVLMVGNPDNLNIENNHIKIQKIAGYNRASLLRRALSWIKASFQCQWYIINKYRDHELFLISNPPTSSFLTLISKRIYYSMIYDVYPDALASGGFLSEKNLLINLWAKFNKHYFAHAKSIFTITNGMASRVSKYVDAERINVVPIWYNSYLNRIERKDNLFLKEYNLEKTFNIIYSGNIGKGHNVKLLPEIAYLLRDQDNIRFVIIGEGWEKQQVIDRVNELKLNNVLILPRLPLEMVSHSLSGADLCYISVDGWASTISVPSKTYNSIFLGSPLLCIANENSEIAKLINENYIGSVFESSQISEIAEYIKKISCNPNALTELKENALKLSQKFSKNNASTIASIIARS